MHAGNLCNIFNVKLFVQMTQFEKLGEHLDMCWTNILGSNKVNKTTFASDIFLFGSQNNKKITDFY